MCGYCIAKTTLAAISNFGRLFICYSKAMHVLPQPKYHLIGHRGVAGLRPENTLCSFRYAAELNLNWIEFDVQLTADNVWVVMHDETLDRTTSGHGPVRAATAREITALDAGSWFKPPFPDEKVPTLLQTLQLARTLNLICDVEIKGAEHDPRRHAQAFADFYNEHKDLMHNRIQISSFNLDCLILLRTMLPDVPMSFIRDKFGMDLIELVKTHNFYSINCSVKDFSIEQLRAAQQAHIPVFLYTVNDPTTAKEWIAHDVTALFSDRPDLLVAAR